MTPSRSPASPAPSTRQMPTSWPARLAFGLLAVMWCAAGWFFLLQGRFASTHRYSRDVTVVEAPAAVLFVCAVFFTLAALASAIVLRSLRAPRWLVAATVLLLLGLPAGWVVLR